jgi:signal transduction histidine kinase
MRLSRFIIEHLEPMVQEWEHFARSMDTPGKPLDTEALRNHAEPMLRAIAADLDTEQSAQQQVDKAQGHGPAADSSAAESHAITRLLAGFTIDQVVAEFRALRASVVRQWMVAVKAGEEFEVEDMIRFNEAIDQALAESIASYTSAVHASRNIFLGILGHDLRTPLSAILLGADVLLRTDDLGARATKIASRIYSSVKRASQIVGDLLDFTRSQLGPGIPIKRTLIDMAPSCERIVDESRTVYAEATIVFNCVEHAQGHFDGARLEQVFSNLISNALQHGARQMPVTVTLERTDKTLLFSVHNSGNPIPEEILPFIFNPMGRYSPHSAIDYGPNASLGLGLFIAAEIVAAHAGLIEVSSTLEGGTLFVVQLPLVTGEDQDAAAD